MKEGFNKIQPNYQQTDYKTLLIFEIHGVDIRYISNCVMMKMAGNN